MRTATISLLALVLGASLASANEGREANRAFNYCLEKAVEQCGSDTIRCRSYQKGFIKACMIEIGVNPEYIRLLLEE